MKEKLTKETFKEKWYWSDRGPGMEEIWQAIEEDRAGRYELGERVEVNEGTINVPKWGPGIIGCNPEVRSGELYTDTPKWVRRPVAMRKMTDDELTGAMLEYLKKPYDKFERSTLELMARDLGISTEVAVK
jgi:hypothetical protein